MRNSLTLPSFRRKNCFLKSYKLFINFTLVLNNEKRGRQNSVFFHKPEIIRRFGVQSKSIVNCFTVMSSSKL